MHHLVSSVIAASLLLTPMSVPGKQNQGTEANSSQSNLSERSSECERVRITLNSGRKIDADSYKRHDDHVAITKKRVTQIFADKDVKRVEVSQGSCPDVVVTLKTGGRVEGYWRGQTCDVHCNCSAEVSQKNKMLSIPASDIKDIDIKYKKPFREKLVDVALVPLYPIYALLFFIGCRNGCD